MTSLSALSRWTASTLLVSAVACGDSATELEDRAARQRDASPDPALGLSGQATIDIKMIPGNSSLYGYGQWVNDVGSTVTFQVTGSGFPPGRSYAERLIAVFNDGFVIMLGGGGGPFMPDGSFRMALTTQCPTRIREVYEVVAFEGQRVESKRVVPMC
jgi:hypothetical protein